MMLVSSARPLAWIPTCVLPDRTRRGCFEYVGGPVSLVSGSATGRRVARLLAGDVDSVAHDHDAEPPTMFDQLRRR